ncbi:glycosyl transferase [Caldichromatium japonicum]|uniref:Glycosyl transferase n=1 Tax=Caldichromatium japonicum TaxID=2699430 RepID=A0A6G7VCR0_9GAMM|nr:glycosyl transferase [Caldichromatium japonicum]QIK37690.1 glycosyl transferase [Caldichromatium japonicum]
MREPMTGEGRDHRLCRRRLEVVISDSGAGQLRFKGLALTRWPGDPIEDALGSLLYLRDLDSGELWSLGYQPTRTLADDYRAADCAGGFRLEREDHRIRLRLDLRLDETLDLERRCLRIDNGSGRRRRLELTSYLEVVLFPADADAAHPAFSKLFVETARDPGTGALIARRRPRSAGESWPCLVHALVGAEAGQWETDRARFIGRGHTLARPLALLGALPLSGSLGPVLDPILSLRTWVELEAGEGCELTWLTGAADPDGLAALLATIAAERRAQPAAPLPPWQPACAGTDPAKGQAGEQAEVRSAQPAEGLLLFNGYGGFDPAGRFYEIRIAHLGAGHRRPPQPWINVIANPDFGCLVSDSGAGYTWSRNSQVNRLTPWSNDPVCDPHSEALYLRDEETGESWSPWPGPRPAPADYRVQHGWGFSRCLLDYAGLEHETLVFVARQDPVKIQRLRLTNRTGRARRLAILSYQRLVLGQRPVYPSPIVAARDPRGFLRATNPDAGAFAGAIVFGRSQLSGATLIGREFTTERLAFIGHHRNPTDPIALAPGFRLAELTGAGRDPCFAEHLLMELAPGETMTCDLLFGEALNEDQLADLLARYAEPAAIAAAHAEAVGFWGTLTSSIQVETPEPALDRLFNGWALYQTLGCRIWARSAFYQSGGAFGFRDQLQDALALTMIRPDLTRAQILLHAAQQLVEGDVLHWWHPEPLGWGLRTRFSDDLLWLPYATAHYVRTTGDLDILAEPIPYLQAPLLAPGEDERYLKPEPSSEVGDLYDHCCRAIDRSLTQGPHGLPLMGTGDWNDGMNRVGREGRGESVWLGFFLYRLIEDFLPLCQGRGDRGRAARYRAYQERLKAALEDAGWDGAWYRRAYDDDGAPLGTAQDSECRIDALAQSWAVLSGAASAERADRSLDALERELIDETARLIRLLAPPFVNTPRDPGYIKGYVAGVRENGGQYTHAACWSVAALAELGRCERAAPLLAMLSPASHTPTPEDVERYRLEPYAIAADIYGAPPHIGRGGWSWYTGSSGWWLRVGLEWIFGVRLEGGRRLLLRPCIPKDWPGFSLGLQLTDGSECAIQVENTGGRAVIAAWLDGDPLPLQQGAACVLLSGGPRRYAVKLRLG